MIIGSLPYHFTTMGRGNSGNVLIVNGLGSGTESRAALAILISFVATLYPARTASRIAPAEAPRYEWGGCKGTFCRR